MTRGVELINTIKQKILQQDAGSFQIMCDAILTKEGYANILSLGTQAGTQKTTPGTPDTYFFDNGNKKYVFVEYTTQQTELVSKIKDDVKKCLDVSKTGISTDDISEIIYFHTSSNIQPKDDKDIRNMCENLGIAFRMYGIDQLAGDLYFKHKKIAKDMLGISIDTDQIKNLDDFIKTYNENTLVAPINTAFLYREKELSDIEDAFKTKDVVIVSGSSGVGKTKICIHFAEQFSQKDSRKLLCVRDNALPIYDDLKFYIDSPGKYIVFVDDANQLNGPKLKHILQYTLMKEDGYDVKILVSARDYATEKLKHDISSITSFAEIRVETFKKEEIETLLEQEFSIRNPLYFERINRISQGNARLAMLAGKISSDANRLDSINDVSQLYDEYYGAVVRGNDLFDDSKVLIVAGIMSVLKSIHLDNIGMIMPLLEAHNIDKELFMESIKRLFECEIVDIYYDKAVKVTEQCFANFLLKYVFYDKQAIELSELIEIGFFEFKHKTIETINTLNNIFKNDDIIVFTEKQIKVVWEKLKNDDTEKFFEFVKSFYLINPTESLLMVQELINKTETVYLPVENINTSEGKNYEKVDDDIINILIGFANDENWEIGLDLLLQYYLKRPDLFIQFYHGINIAYRIDRFASIRKYDLQIKLFKNLKKNSINFENEYINLLFLELVPEFLSFSFSSAESSGDRSLILYNVNLLNDNNSMEYRALIWNMLIEFSKKNSYQPKVYKILNKYSTYICKESEDIVEKEHQYIIEIFNELPYKESLIVSILAKQINNSVVRHKLKEECIIPDTYINSAKMSLFSLLSAGNCEFGTNYKEREKQKKEKIKQCIFKDANILIRMIDVCNELSDCPFVKNFYAVLKGLEIAFDELPNDKDVLLKMVGYYLKTDTPLSLHPRYIIKKMFKCISACDIFSLINSYDYCNKNTWNYEYYYQLPGECITEAELESFYIFLDDATGFKTNEYHLREIGFIKKFNRIQNDAFEKSCRMILSKKDVSSFIPCIYFELLFDPFSDVSKETIELFDGNLQLLIEIYMYIISVKKSVDEDGAFLNKIYCVDKSILDIYVNYIINARITYEDNIYNRLCSFYSEDEYISLFNYAVNKILDVKKYPEYDIQQMMSCLITPVSGKQELIQKQDKWIKDYIKENSQDCIKIKCLFTAISRLENKRKKEYLLLFIEKNPDYKAFDQLKLIPTNYTWSGSEAPILSGFIEYFETLLPHLNGIKYLEHKNKVNRMIEAIHKDIETEEIRESLLNQ